MKVADDFKLPHDAPIIRIQVNCSFQLTILQTELPSRYRHLAEWNRDTSFEKRHKEAEYRSLRATDLRNKITACFANRS